MKPNSSILSKQFLYFLIILQTIAVLLLFAGVMDLLSQILVFKGTDDFIAVDAKCIRAKQYTASPTELYNNTYEYIAGEDTYQVTFYGENEEGTDKKLYYNPTYPPTCSKYSNLWIALLCNSTKFILGLIAQIFFIIYMIKRRRAK